MIKHYPKIGKKAVVLFVVLVTIIMVSTLASVILNIILSHYRLTHHQASRVQAYYAAQAGMNYAIEMLRKGPTAGGWAYPANCTSAPCLITDSDFPGSINSVQVVFCPVGNTCAPSLSTCRVPAGSSLNFCINTTVNYTYTQP